MNYLLDGLVALAGFRDDGEVLREYVPGVSVSSGSESLYYHYERLGSIRFLSDSSGSVVSEYVYDGWGNILSSSSSFSQQYEYVGREGYYRESGLYLLGQRWYDSEVGRFISRDPIGEGLFTNIIYYQYTGNPLNYLDPSGMFCIWAGSNTQVDWIRISPIRTEERWVKIDEIHYEDFLRCSCKWQKYKTKVWQEIPYYKKKINWICYEKCKGWYRKTTTENWTGNSVERGESIQPISEEVTTWGPLINPISNNPLCLCPSPK